MWVSCRLLMGRLSKKEGKMKGITSYFASLSPKKHVPTPEKQRTCNPRRGALVKGVALALLMAMCDRPATFAELTGAGVAILASRIQVD